MELYKDALQLQYKEHKLHDKISTTLHNFHDKGSTIQNISEYEQRDDRITRAKKYAEKQCGRYPYGYEWSPDIQHAGTKYLHWQTNLKYTLRGIAITDSIKKKHHELHEDDTIPTSINKIIQIVRATKRRLKEVQKFSKTLREEFLEQQAEYNAQKNNKQKEQILTQQKIQKKVKEYSNVLEIK